MGHAARQQADGLHLLRVQQFPFLAPPQHVGRFVPGEFRLQRGHGGSELGGAGGDLRLQVRPGGRQLFPAARSPSRKTLGQCGENAKGLPVVLRHRLARRKSVLFNLW